MESKLTKRVELNYLVTDGVLKRGSIVRLTKFEPSVVKEKRLAGVLLRQSCAN